MHLGKSNDTSRIRPKAASRPSAKSLIARGLVRDANNRVQCGSKAVPIDTMPKGRYVLYSSESDSDRVKSMNLGLDRCASLLANILEEDDKVKTVAVVSPKKRTPKRKGKKKKLQLVKRQEPIIKNAPAVKGNIAKKSIKSKKGVPAATKSSETEAASTSPLVDRGDAALVDVETLVQKSIVDDRREYDISSQQVVQLAENVDVTQVERGKNDPLTPAAEPSRDLRQLEHPTKQEICSDGILKRPSSQSLVELSPKYQELEDALLRITSKLNAPLRVMKDLKSEDKRIAPCDTSISSQDSEASQSNFLRKFSYISSGTRNHPAKNRYMSTLSDLGDTDLKGKRTQAWSTPRTGEASAPTAGELVNRIVVDDEDDTISFTDASAKEQVAIDFNPTARKIIGDVTLESLDDIEDTIQGEGKGMLIKGSPKTNEITLKDKENINSLPRRTPSPQQEPDPKAITIFTSSQPRATAVNQPSQNDTLISSLDIQDISHMDARQKINYLMRKLMAHGTGNTDLETVVNIIETSINELISTRATRERIQNECYIKELQLENTDLKKELTNANLKCQEYDKMAEIYAKALKTALEAKQDQINQRNEQLQVEKSFHEAVKKNSALEDDVRSLKNKLTTKEDQLKQTSKCHEEEKRGFETKLNDIKAQLSQSELAVKLLQKENRILNITLEQSRAESERLRELNSGLKQSLANLMNDLEKQDPLQMPIQKTIPLDVADDDTVSEVSSQTTQLTSTMKNQTFGNDDQMSVANENSVSTVDEIEFNDRIRTLDLDIQRLQNSLRAKRLKL